MTKFFNQFIYILIIIFNSIYYVESIGGMGRGGIGGGGGKVAHIAKIGGNPKMTNTYNENIHNRNDYLGIMPCIIALVCLIIHLKFMKR